MDDCLKRKDRVVDYLLMVIIRVTPWLALPVTESQVTAWPLNQWPPHQRLCPHHQWPLHHCNPNLYCNLLDVLYCVSFTSQHIYLLSFAILLLLLQPKLLNRWLYTSLSIYVRILGNITSDPLTHVALATSPMTSSQVKPWPHHQWPLTNPTPTFTSIYFNSFLPAVAQPQSLFYFACFSNNRS